MLRKILFAGEYWELKRKAILHGALKFEGASFAPSKRLSLSLSLGPCQTLLAFALRTLEQNRTKSLQGLFYGLLVGLKTK